MTGRADTSPRLRFWFEFASTYSYLSALRIEALANQAGVALEWCPFLLGPIFAARGWQTSPFNVYPDKGRHMWRDMERRAALYGFAFRKPAAFPQNGLLAARVTLVGLAEGWAPAFVRAVFEAQFVGGENIADRATLERLIERAGGDARATLDVAATDAVKADLRRRNDEAASLGIFGAPSFIADGELFWGDDRLEEAVAWCVGLHPARATPP
jgi:2-hydroxychromene-2-carboxylate isomerase